MNSITRLLPALICLQRFRQEMEDITLQQHQHEKNYKIYHAKSKHPQVSPSLQLQQKTAIFSNLAMPSKAPPQKQVTFESRTCKDLMAEKFKMVNLICGLGLKKLLIDSMWYGFNTLCYSNQSTYICIDTGGGIRM